MQAFDAKTNVNGASVHIDKDRIGVNSEILPRLFSTIETRVDRGQVVWQWVAVCIGLERRIDGQLGINRINPRLLVFSRIEVVASARPMPVIVGVGKVEPVCPSPRTGHRKRGLSPIRACRRPSKPSCVRAEQERAHPYLRCATPMQQNGIDLRVIQQILGHKSPQTTSIYAHLTQKTVDLLQATVNHLMNEL